MKKVVLSMAFAALMMSCTPDLSGVYDAIDDNTARIEDIEGRVETLEQKIAALNTNVASLQTIVEALQKNVSVTKVETLSDGYKIYFSDGTTATIKNGKNGQDGQNGQDGKTPVVSVKQDTDGVWYWTIDGEWLIVDGNKVVAVGKDGQEGKDGKTPEFKVDDEGNLYVRFSSDEEWTVLGNIRGPKGSDGEDGEDGEDGKDGKDGDSFFASVVVNETAGTVTVTLNDGSDTVIVLPLAGDSLVAKVTSIEFVPAYSDGMATLSVDKAGKAVLEAAFDVRPAAVAEQLAAKPEYLSFTISPIATRAALSIAVSSASYANGKLTLKADASAYAEQSIAISLLVNDGKAEIASAYVGVKKVESFITYAGETYNVVTMKDGRTWMAENLRYLPDGIEARTDFVANTGVWVPANVSWDGTTATTTVDADNWKTQGYLYTEAVALAGATIPTTDFEDVADNKGICPDGWHIPTAQEWIDLFGACAATAHNNTSAPYYDASLSGASLEVLNADGFNFIPYPVVNQSKSWLASVLNKDPERAYCGMASMVYFASSTGRSATQSYAGMITNNGTKSSCNCAYNNITNGVYVRCIKNK